MMTPRFSILFCLLLAWSAHAADWYVATNGTGQGTSWADSTNSLQGAITACASNYTVWVSNGTYVVNLTVGGGVTIRSKTGLPADVILDGNAAGRVVTMTVSSWLVGCTVINGLKTANESYEYGGGTYLGSVSNCIISGNTAYAGGGSLSSKIYNSTISGNTAVQNGGGGRSVTCYNCVISNNSAEDGGGVSYSTLYNCLISENTCTKDGGAGDACAFRNCTVTGNIGVNGGGGAASSFENCISWGNNKADDFINGGFETYSCGAGYSGAGSIASDPLFVSSSDFHLQRGSPCVNTGSNFVWTAGARDLGGNPRVRYGTADMGAYEWEATLIIGGTGIGSRGGTGKDAVRGCVQ